MRTSHAPRPLSRMRSRLVSALGLLSVSVLAACGKSSSDGNGKAPGPRARVEVSKRPEQKDPVRNTTAPIALAEKPTLESIIAKAESATFENPVLLPEVVIREAAKKKAKRADRPLFVDYTGAWCGPCQMFNVSKKSGDQTLSAEAFGSTFEQFEHLEIEEMLTTFYWNFGVPVRGIPSMYVYEPRNEAWSHASAGFFDLKTLATGLIALFTNRDGVVPPTEDSNDTPDSQPPVDQQIATFHQLIDRVAAGGTVSETFEEEWDALEVLESSELPFEKKLELLSAFSKLSTTNPKGLKDLHFSSILQDVISEPLASKKVSLEGLEASHPELFQADLVNGGGWIKNYAFREPISRILHQSVSAGDLVCQELLDFVQTRFLASQPAPLSDRIRCALIGSFVERVPQADVATLLAEAESLDSKDEKRPYDSQLVRLAAAAGDFEKAQTYVDKLLTEYRDYATQKLADLDTQAEEKAAALAAATDEAAKKEIQDALDSIEFQKAVQRSKQEQYENVETRYKDAFNRKVRSPMMLDPLFLEATGG